MLELSPYSLEYGSRPSAVAPTEHMDRANQPDPQGPEPGDGSPFDIAQLLLAAIVSTGCFLICAVHFASAQCIWLDEATQLAGLSLGPIEVLRWLTGKVESQMGVMTDRMPPMSYWIGWIWWEAFGTGEATARSMGVFATALACATVAVTAGRLAGPRGAFIAGLLFALSPNVVTTAPTIRAYPLLMAFSAVAFLVLVLYIQQAREKSSIWLALLLTISLAATYTHYFGLVLGGATLVSAFVIRLLRRRPTIGPILAGIALLVLSAGLAPFIGFALQVSESIGPVDGGPSFFRLLYRLVGHPAASVDPFAAGLLGLGFGGLILLAVLPRWRNDSGWSIGSPGTAGLPGAGSFPRLDVLAVPIALVSGLGVTFLLGLKVRSFGVYSPHYSIWAIPGLCIVAGTAGAPGLGKRLQFIWVFCAAAALIGSIWSQLVIYRHHECFTGPHRAIVSLLESAPRGKLPIIVLEREGCWEFIYFPLRFAYGTRLEQYLMPESGSGPPERWPMKSLGSTSHPAALLDLPKDRSIVIVRASAMGQAELRRELRGGGERVPTGVLMDRVEHQLRWPVVRSCRHFGLISAQARMFAPGHLK
jgi:hypothetical protein